MALEHISDCLHKVHLYRAVDLVRAIESKGLCEVINGSELMNMLIDLSVLTQSQIYRAEQRYQMKHVENN